MGYEVVAEKRVGFCSLLPFACVCVCHAPNLGAVPSQRAFSFAHFSRAKGDRMRRGYLNIRTVRGHTRANGRRRRSGGGGGGWWWCGGGG
eukprot:762952-Prymnesium_polylepis.1